MNTQYNQLYIAIDRHSKHFVIGYMDKAGQYIQQRRVQTGAENLQREVARISADRKQLTIEQGNQSFWAAQMLAPYVDHLIICDPHYNRLIVDSEDKSDPIDTKSLCKLLRLGALKEIWRPKQMGHRRLFYGQVKEYEWINKQMVIAKRRLQASLQHWGCQLKISKSDWKHPKQMLSRLGQPTLTGYLRPKLDHIKYLARQKADQLERIVQAGRGYPEIGEFQKMSGVGKVYSHTFSAYIQTPYRFSNRRQLISFSKLGVVSRSSDGRVLKGEHLSRAGHSSLKNLSYGIWKSAMGSDNEVSGSYQASLDRCKDATHARLNTQRKILITLWSVWKNNWTYQPSKFWANDGVASQ
jgi:transposase